MPPASVELETELRRQAATDFPHAKWHLSPGEEPLESCELLLEPWMKLVEPLPQKAQVIVESSFELGPRLLWGRACSVHGAQQIANDVCPLIIDLEDEASDRGRLDEPVRRAGGELNRRCPLLLQDELGYLLGRESNMLGLWCAGRRRGGRQRNLLSRDRHSYSTGARGPSGSIPGGPNCSR